MVAEMLFALVMALGISSRVVSGVTSSTSTGLESYTANNVNSSASAHSDSSSHESFHPDYPDCNNSDASLYIGDGYCDISLNIVSCGWDGGDCCACTCNSGAYYGCSLTYDFYDHYYCEDPSAQFYLGDAGCQNTLRPPEGSLCPQEQVELVINSTASATALAEATLCSGGNFTVEWEGNVHINETIHVLNGTYLNITGVSNAEADGRGTAQIFFVYNGSLYLNNMGIVHGVSSEGGAIILAADSELFADFVAFNSNTAQNTGGAIFAENSTIELTSTNFDKNSARNGGAIFVHNSDVVGSGNISFINNSAFENGGALYIMKYSSIEWNVQSVVIETTLGDTFDVNYVFDSGVTTFFKNSAGGSGGAMYVDDSDIYWSGTTLLEQNSAWYGGALYLTNWAYVIIEGTTTFASNSAILDGGAIGATEGGVYFTANGSTTFTNNVCKVNGGAINLLNADLNAEGNVAFSNNSAVSFGGALYASQLDDGPTLIGANFSGNTAESGGAVYFSAVGTDLYLSSDSEYENIYMYSSAFNGCRFDSNSASSTGGAVHSIAGSDYMLNTTFVKNSASIGGAIRVSGVVYMSSSSFEDNISGDGGGPAISNSGVLSKMTGLTFLGNIFYCSADAFVDMNKTNDEDYRYGVVCDGCDIECEACTIEGDKTVPVCSGLLDHTKSEGGTATLETLVLDPGYWRATNTSRNILECFNKDACRGGVTENITYCSRGYEGPYCAVCSQDYVRTISHRCSKCSAKTSFGPALFAVFGGLAGLLLLFFVYYMILIEGGRTTRNSIDRFKKIFAVQSLKIIIVSWQIVTQFSEVTNAVYPNLYKELLEVIAVVNFDLSWILSAGCFDVDFYDGLIAATAGPLAVMALLGVTYAIALRRSRASELGQRIVRRKHANAVILLAFLVYSSASSAVFRTFVCDSLDDGKVYLRADYRIICTSPKHTAFEIYAGFMIAVYPLGIPVLFAILLFRNRKVLKNPTLRTYNGELLQQSTSTLWKPYKPSVFYYEVVECGRRFMLAGIMVFIYPNTAAQIAVTLAMAFIFALTSECLNPYESRVDGWVARIGNVMVVLTMFVALLTKVDVSSEGAQSQYMFAAILVTAHIAMVLTGVAEAVLLICSVQQNDSPLPRPRSVPVLPVDNFSPIHDRGRELDR